MNKVVFVVMFSLISFTTFAQDRVQISSERDEEGKFTNWSDLTVDWEADVVTVVPDHSGSDMDSLQEWFVPVSGGWKFFKFTRTELGEYAVRWSRDGTLWSKPGVCEIKEPESPQHKGT